jgi:hypothetical protein
VDRVGADADVGAVGILVILSSLTGKRGFLSDGARKWAGRRTPGEDQRAAEKIEGHGASTLLALG